MRRKIVQQGPCTLMVSIPKEFCQRHSLKKGDILDLRDCGQFLQAAYHEKEDAKTSALSFSSSTESAIRIAIINSYRCGHSCINVDFKEDNQYNIICTVVSENIMGLEVTRTSNNTCRIESINEPDIDQFQMILKKMIFCISTMITDTVQRLDGKKDFSDYNHLGIKIEKYENFCLRVVATDGRYTASGQFYSSLLSKLSHCSRELYHLNKYIEISSNKIAKSSFAEPLYKIFTLFEGSFFKKSTEMIEKLHQYQNQIIFSQYYKSIASKKGVSVIDHHLACAIRHIHLASSPLMG
ncbi:hypothetical protein COV93_00695, partial [Candidatus Woesearchaeota archaeon CG11_big_fil_rev_8_21_14_0_20_43_8]